MTTDFTTLTLDEAQKLGREPLTEEDCERMVDDHYREVEMHKPMVIYEDKLDGGSVTSSGPVLSITATAFPFDDLCTLYDVTRERLAEVIVDFLNCHGPINRVAYHHDR